MGQHARLKGAMFSPDAGVLWGDIYDDPKKRFEDGTFIHTSSVKKVTPTEYGVLVETRSGTLYAITKDSFMGGEKGWNALNEIK